MNIVIYGSQYGTAKRYAEELSNRLGFELRSYEEVADVNLYDTIIYVGALYAGGVLGRKQPRMRQRIRHLAHSKKQSRLKPYDNYCY